MHPNLEIILLFREVPSIIMQFFEALKKSQTAKRSARTSPVSWVPTVQLWLPVNVMLTAKAQQCFPLMTSVPLNTPQQWQNVVDVQTTAVWRSTISVVDVNSSQEIAVSADLEKRNQKIRCRIYLNINCIAILIMNRFPKKRQNTDQSVFLVCWICTRTIRSHFSQNLDSVLFCHQLPQERFMNLVLNLFQVNPSVIRRNWRTDMYSGWSIREWNTFSILQSRMNGKNLLILIITTTVRSLLLIRKTSRITWIRSSTEKLILSIHSWILKVKRRFLIVL